MLADCNIQTGFSAPPDVALHAVAAAAVHCDLAACDRCACTHTHASQCQAGMAHAAGPGCDVHKEPISLSSCVTQEVLRCWPGAQLCPAAGPIAPIASCTVDVLRRSNGRAAAQPTYEHGELIQAPLQAAPPRPTPETPACTCQEVRR